MRTMFLTLVVLLGWTPNAAPVADSVLIGDVAVAHVGITDVVAFNVEASEVCNSHGAFIKVTVDGTQIENKLFHVSYSNGFSETVPHRMVHDVSAWVQFPLTCTHAIVSDQQSGWCPTHPIAPEDGR